MRNIPVNLSGFKLTITEAPTLKMRENENKELVVATDHNGVQQYVVALFAKPVAREGQRAGKGEEIRVTLATEPSEEFEEGMRVELIDATVSAWAMGDRSGLSFRALGLKPAGERGLSSAA
ncbi:hypothetical protein SAMN05421835_105152 [Amycolatopsis sacchari]|uniref:Uncharacterized protein n=1 Tax=Amycolatopsis sacchari TaxID=115433 RepID=A0A1I3R8Q9_9PSEU|nr:hypothetical protein [Amycolatopsis sacchari]SFJ41596.1 hypothetical protein SAMN05421835_105152 [Amycolatopsis sacchari]